MVSLVWFRDDLRLHDHPALCAAAQDPGGMVAVYVLDDDSPEVRPAGSASRWWLHHSLLQLRASLAERGILLVLRRGAARDVIPQVVAQTGADAVVWNRRYSDERTIDADLKITLRAQGVRVTSFVGNVLFEPWTVTTQTGGVYRVYSAFWRACRALPMPAAPREVPQTLSAAPVEVRSDALDAWGLLPVRPNWAAEFSDFHDPGEHGAQTRLREFLDDDVARYDTDRDTPAIAATSRLSAHLRWGDISPRTVWHAALAAGDAAGGFLSELGWREFAWHTAYHVPALDRRSLDQRFEQYPWRTLSTHEWDAWCRGTTGFALVDAGMRELWRSGNMHNRVRMIAASFLTKNLGADWRLGEAWFWDTLVDADVASNPFNWQWVAGCGRDAAPYFRVFNPETQAKKFDPDGRYANRWAPDTLTYPPLCDLKETRLRALAGYDSIRGAHREEPA